MATFRQVPVGGEKIENKRNPLFWLISICLQSLSGLVPPTSK
jgi:hypothetical protein